jgi:hypothetical protein
MNNSLLPGWQWKVVPNAPFMEHLIDETGAIRGETNLHFPCCAIYGKTMLGKYTTGKLAKQAIQNEAWMEAQGYVEKLQHLQTQLLNAKKLLERVYEQLEPTHAARVTILNSTGEWFVKTTTASAARDAGEAADGPATAGDGQGAGAGADPAGPAPA